MCCTAPELVLHIEEHHHPSDGEPLQFGDVCTLCGQASSAHTTRTPNVECFICCHCDTVFAKRNRLVAHMKIHSGRKKSASEPKSEFLCFVCEQTFVDKNEYLVHMRHCSQHAELLSQALQKCNDEMLVCLFCNEVFVSKDTIKEHLAQVHGQTEDFECGDQSSFLCQICKDVVDRKCTIPHMEAHFFKSYQKCPFCAEIFEHAHSLWSHIFGKHPRRVPSCSLCEVPVENHKELVKHLLVSHGIVMKLVLKTKRGDKHFKEQSRIFVDGIEKFRCLECSSVVNTYSSLRRHMSYAHTDETPYVCDRCSKAFKTKNKLVIHYNSVHERTRSYNCHFCGRGFAISSNLTKHIRIHTGEKPYVCDLCGMTFAQSSSLYSHKITHAQNACYECAHCGKAFLRPWQLKKHEMTIHMGVYAPKNRVCAECGKSFRTNHELKRHQDIHTSVRSFICEHCNAGFTLKKYLLQHYKTHAR